ncbi:MAG: branched-chain amino acid ABC transporter permease [Rhodoferax sp.]|nr:branched-chain amino acid ABC transporter permease [Rhodoferax sp.]
MSVSSPSQRSPMAASTRSPGGLQILSFTGAQSIAFLIMVGLLVLSPTVVYPVFLMKILCYAIFACSLNLIAGYGGMMSFGHAAYFGIGAYTAAWCTKNWAITPEIGILLGGATGALAGLVFGWLAIRRPGMFFTMVTMAIGQAVYFICVQAPFTNGEDGIQKVPRGQFLGLISLTDNMTMYWLVVLLFLGVFLFLHRLTQSPLGHVLKSIRDNEPRATSLGYKTQNFKLITYVLATFLAGVAGSTKAIVFGIATLTDVGFNMSGEVVMMALFGGMGTIFGPVVGATLTASLSYYLSPFGAWIYIVQGTVFALCVLLFRRGIIGEINMRWNTKL